MKAKHTPMRGWLGNGSWLVAVHTKSCARSRRNVTPARRARELIPNRLEQFAVAARARAAINQATKQGE